MNLAVIGSRSFNDYEFLSKTLDEIIEKHLDPFALFTNDLPVIISGGARGTDTLAERYADSNNYKKIIYLPDWNKYGRNAGMIRNKLIIKDAKIVICFWDGFSKGSKNSLDLARKQNKKLYLMEGW